MYWHFAETFRQIQIFHYLINFIMHLIHYGGLEGDVKLSVSEKYLSNAGKSPVPLENTAREEKHE